MEILSWPSLGSELTHTSNTTVYSIAVSESMAKVCFLASWKRRILFSYFSLILWFEKYETENLNHFFFFFFWVLPLRKNLQAFHRRETLSSGPIQKENNYHVIIVVLYGLLLLYVALISTLQSVVWELRFSVLTWWKLDIMAVHAF